ncbi:hypothetical protein [Hymenobacter cellulosivorans]|uniref:DUF4288 domain-containing protein n=1 Tax=Hymenobacter cellulosivorans TaxID=2932249 RepID=A0ABY4FGF6_9BACT|nr:hypothetical protein [Hymenobacter cellulosivorans]UOQ55201.1 hypothetical protein MUN80_10685 [Hymenobacter cellulosivorans]
MQIYSYWARTTLDIGDEQQGPFLLTAYTGSDESLAAAQAAGRQVLQHRAARLQAAQPLRAGDYPTGSAPLREQVEQRIVGSGGELLAAVTRNHYGSRVLNTAQVMLLDVDDADLRRPIPTTEPFSLAGFFRKLFGPASPPPPPLVPQEQIQLRMAAWLQLHPEWNFRLYRTRLGFRLLVTHQLIAPASPEAQEIFAALRVDTTYVRLCQAQDCYRARLTPKPWRIGSPRPPHPFPYDTPEQQATQQAWEAQYTTLSQPFSVCHWVGEYGSGQVLAEARQVAELHDAACVGSSELA